MQITEIVAGTAVVVALDGRLDTASAGAVEARLLALLERGAVVADLGAVRYVSSAGLRVLLKAAKAARAAGRGFVLCGLQPSVRDVFEMSGFDRVIAAYPGREAALAAAC